MNKQRTIIIGLDGVPYSLLYDLAEDGVMPNVKSLIEKGIFRQMASSIPEISSVAWSSIVTGKNPGEHGIFGFIDLFPNSYRIRFPNFYDLKASPFWVENDGVSVIINVPSTYPVKPMRGVHISGFVSIDFEKSVYPSSIIPTLKKMDYRLDVDSAKAHTSAELFLSDLDKTLDARIRAYEYLWNEFEWNTFMLVFTGTDRLMHFFWDAYQDSAHTYHKHFIEHFHKIDTAIGEIKRSIKEEDLLVMLSDHGFEKLEKDVYINYLLKSEHFLCFEDDDNPELTKITSETKAFALDPARIYINLKNKYPCGSVDLRDKEKVLRDLEALFKSVECEGRKVIKKIFRKEEIYSGPFLDEAPDLILLGERGFNLKANVKSNNLFDKAIFTGKHTQHDAFLLLYGDRLPPDVPDKLAVNDVRWVVYNRKVIAT